MASAYPTGMNHRSHTAGSLLTQTHGSISRGGGQRAGGSAACVCVWPCQTWLVLMTQVCCADQLCGRSAPVHPVAYFFHPVMKMATYTVDYSDSFPFCSNTDCLLTGNKNDNYKEWRIRIVYKLKWKKSRWFQRECGALVLCLGFTLG